MDAIIVGIVMFTGLAVVAIAMLKQWAVENRRLLIEERVKLDEMNQRILNLDDGTGGTAREIQALREEIQHLSRQIADLKEQIQLRGSTELRG